MTSPVWQATVTDDTGDVLPGAQIDVVIESTGTDATLFSNRAGTTSLSNPFFADSEGFAQFYTDAGAYRITATASGGGTTRTWRYVSLFDFDANVIGSGDLYGRDSILGTVSETAGVPTGAIIESGSNSDGYWSQFADGTQIETVSILEELDSSIANKGDVTNFDMDRSAPLSSSWDKANYSCHGRGIGGGGDRSDLALAGRLNENVKVYRPIGLVTSNTGDVTSTSYYISIDLQLITRWF